MEDTEKIVSKAYRKILISSEMKAFLVYEKLNDEIKLRVENKIMDNDSEKAQSILRKIHRL